MIRRVFLAFWVFALVACGDDGTGLKTSPVLTRCRRSTGGDFPRFLKKPKPLSSSRLQQGV